MRRHNPIEDVVIFVSTWFYSGLMRPIVFRKMSGTYGSFFSLPFCFLVLFISGYFSHSWIIYYGCTLYIFILGFSIVPIAERVLGPRTDYKGRVKYHDQNEIVIDETFGMMITCSPLLFLPVALFSWTMALLLFIAFLYFRLFDIIKIPPTKFFDRMPNAFGVMMDDGIAAVYAAICLLVTYRFLF